MNTLSMEVAVYKDLFAIRFIRCVSPVPNTAIMAGGAGITLKNALAKCESEIIERSFELLELRPLGIRPVGISAHTTEKLAYEKAKQEAIETLCLEQIHSEKEFRCLYKLRFLNSFFGITRTSHGYFSMIIGNLDNQKFAAYSASSSLFGTIMKTWEEFRSIHFFKPQGDELRTFTKANYRFSQAEFKNLSFRFKPNFVYHPQLSRLKVASDRRSGRHIVYLVNHAGEKTK